MVSVFSANCTPILLTNCPNPQIACRSTDYTWVLKCCVLLAVCFTGLVYETVMPKWIVPQLLNLLPLSLPLPASPAPFPPYNNGAPASLSSHSLLKKIWPSFSLDSEDHLQQEAFLCGLLPFTLLFCSLSFILLNMYSNILWASCFLTAPVFCMPLHLDTFELKQNLRGCTF